MFRSPQATSDDLSELEPRLPIPNRTVKRLSADDSADYPCESRTSSGTHSTRKPGLDEIGLFCLGRIRTRYTTSDKLDLLWQQSRACEIIKFHK